MFHKDLRDNNVYIINVKDNDKGETKNNIKYEPNSKQNAEINLKNNIQIFSFFYDQN